MIQMSFQEVERPFAMNGVGAVEKFDFSLICNSQFRVVPADFCKFPGHPLVDTHSIVMAAFYHEGLGDQHGQFCIVGEITHVPFKDFVFGCPDIAERCVGRGIFRNPFIEVSTTD